MSDGFIAKFVNSEIMTSGGNATPIDTLIKSRASQDLVVAHDGNNDARYQSLLNYVSSSYNRGSIKSIQRGVYQGSIAYSQYTIPISSINPEKAYVILDLGNYGSHGSNHPYVISLNATSLIVSRAEYNSGELNVATPFGWQVIEFY